MKIILILFTSSFITLAADIPKLVVDPTINNIMFSYRSDINGVCRVLGFQKALEETAVYDSTDYSYSIVIDENAKVTAGNTGTSGSRRIQQVICLNYMEEGVTGLEAEIIENPVFQGTDIPLSEESDENKICQQYGFDRSPDDSVLTEAVEDQPSIIIDENGSITGGQTDGRIFTSILCVKD